MKKFILFSGDAQKPVKILAGYHQYFAVRKAVDKLTVGGTGGKVLSLQEINAQINELLKASIQSEGVEDAINTVISQCEMWTDNGD